MTKAETQRHNWRGNNRVDFGLLSVTAGYRVTLFERKGVGFLDSVWLNGIFGKVLPSYSRWV